MSNISEKEHLPQQQNDSNCEEIAARASLCRPLITISCQNVILGNLEEMGKEALKLNDISEHMLQKHSGRGRRCEDCGSKIKENEGEICRWCLIVKKLNEKCSTTGVECENKGRGCRKELTDKKSIADHHKHFCKYRDFTCQFCHEKLPIKTSLADHVVKYHGTDLTAVVNDDLATVDFTLHLTLNYYICYIHLRNLVIFMEICVRSNKFIDIYSVVVADKSGADFMTITATLTNPNTMDTFTTEHFPDDHDGNGWLLGPYDISSLNLLKSAKLDIKLNINVKK